MSAFERFDRIFCINLDRRTERWARSQEEFRAVGLADRVERFSAIERPQGVVGCLESHRECVRLAKASGAERVLIFEDDVHFLLPIEARLSAALGRLETEPWELFFLGAEVVSRAEHFGEHLIRAKMYQAHAYALHRRAFDKLARAEVPIDAWYAEYLACYGARTPLAVQRIGESDTGVGVTDRDVRRSYEIFVEAQGANYVAKRAYYASRRKLGRALVNVAHRVGVPLAFKGGRPRLNRGAE